MIKQNLSEAENWPYPKYEYLLRVFWYLIYSTIWKLSWHRVPFLRMYLLRLFGASTDLSSMAYSSVKFQRPWDLTLGKFVALGPRVNIYNLGKISIGDNTVISQDVYLCGGTHDYRKSNLPLVRKKITIEANVWICAGAFIAPGVNIGEGAVVGARAVVLNDVKPWTIVGGNPAKFIKIRKIIE